MNFAPNPSHHAPTSFLCLPTSRVIPATKGSYAIAFFVGLFWLCSVHASLKLNILFKISVASPIRQIATVPSGEFSFIRCFVLFFVLFFFILDDHSHLGNIYVCEEPLLCTLFICCCFLFFLVLFAIPSVFLCVFFNCLCFCCFFFLRCWCGLCCCNFHAL
ncbi:transmembrane protein, putative [Bodo saltans]|uniref:Transmembrane protein, putative n=1 Tax=Bodo saltans TaxID=75058 RepID=A0A0S4JH96_BODSA|nr:transmembrane protein, putative [Bodo saltans]|eukprot:CUG90858.1 transmembrane protein, putative [Bodo saltans]